MNQSQDRAVAGLTRPVAAAAAIVAELAELAVAVGVAIAAQSHAVAAVPAEAEGRVVGAAGAAHEAAGDDCDLAGGVGAAHAVNDCENGYAPMKERGTLNHVRD